MPTSDVTPNGLAKASCIKEPNIIIGGDVLVIRVAESIIDGVYLSYCITNDKEQVMSFVSGSTVFHLYGSDMKNFEINFPTNNEEQKNIARTLIDMSIEILALEEKLSKNIMLKQGMMQNLLTGKIRLV
jgi:type I restriction enzyme S subunit